MEDFDPGVGTLGVDSAWQQPFPAKVYFACQPGRSHKRLRLNGGRAAVQGLFSSLSVYKLVPR